MTFKKKIEFHRFRFKSIIPRLFRDRGKSLALSRARYNMFCEVSFDCCQQAEENLAEIHVESVSAESWFLGHPRPKEMEGHRTMGGEPGSSVGNTALKPKIPKFPKNSIHTKNCQKHPVFSAFAEIVFT